MNFILDHWKKITALLTILASLFGWCWHSAARIDQTLGRIEAVEKDAPKINAMDKRLYRLEVIEDVREKRGCSDQ